MQILEEKTTGSGSSDRDTNADIDPDKVGILKRWFLRYCMRTSCHKDKVKPPAF